MAWVVLLVVGVLFTPPELLVHVLTPAWYQARWYRMRTRRLERRR